MDVFDDNLNNARVIEVPPVTGDARVLTFENESVGGTDPDDYFRFVAPADGWVYIETRPTEGGIPGLRITNPNGSSRVFPPDSAETTIGRSDLNIVYEYLEEGETYFLQVFPDGNEVSVYDLSIIFAEDNESFDGATTLALDDTRQDNIIRGDPADYYTFIAPESGVVRITLSDLSDNPTLSFSVPFVFFAAYDAEQNVIESLLYSDGQSQSLSFDVVAGEQYYISLSEAPQTELLALVFDDGSYTLTTEFFPVPSDDNETFATAAAQDPSFTVVDSVGGSDPEDVYSIAPTEDGIITLTLSGLTDDADVLAYDGEGVLIGQSRVSGTSNDAVSVVVQADETYYIRVVSKSGDSASYTLVTAFSETSSMPEGDISSTTEDALAIGLGSVVESTLEGATDRDWFEITVSENTPLILRAEGVEGESGALNDPDFVIRRPDGSFVAQETGNPGQPAEITLDDAGTFIVSVRSYAGEEGAYRLSVSQAFGVVTVDDNTDIAGNTSSTAVLELDVPIVSQLENSGESDWFRVTVNEGEMVTVLVEGAETDKGSLSDPTVVLRNADGNFISQTFSERGQNVQTVLDFAGDYWIQVTSINGYAGTYTVTASSEVVVPDVEPDFREVTDIPGNGSTDTIIALGDTVEASLSPIGDSDWFRITLAEGEAHRITVSGRGEEQDQLGIMDVTLVPVDGGAVQRSFGVDGRDTLAYTTTPGEYWIAVNSPTGDSGDYTLTVTDATVPIQVLPSLTEDTDFSGDTTSTAEIEVGQTANASLDSAQDKDWYQLYVSYGQTVQISVTGSGEDGERLEQPDIVLRGFLSNGSFVEQALGTEDGIATLSLTSSGPHWIEVRSFNGDTGNYTLTVSDAIDVTGQSSYTVAPEDSDAGVVDVNAFS